MTRPKGRRTKPVHQITVSDDAWAGVQERIKRLGYKSVSAYLESLGRMDDEVLIENPIPEHVLSPQLRGRHIEHLPTKYQKQYRESLSNPDLLSQWKEIALIDTRVEYLISRLHSGESGELWDTLSDLSKEFQSMNRNPSMMREATELLAELIQTIKEGAQEWKTWREIMNLNEMRRKTVESERKRLIEMRQYYNDGEAQRFATALMEAVKHSVRDSSIRYEISQNFRRIFTEFSERRSRGESE